MKDIVQITVGITVIIGVIYGVFKVESAIYKAIDNLAKEVHSRVNSIERDFSLHIAVYSERKANVDYLLHGLEEKIDHKYNRLFDEIKEIKLELKHSSKQKNEG